MIRFGRLVVSWVLLAAVFSSASAQQLSLADLQSKMVGAWLATVEGEPRTRNFIVDVVAQKSEGAFVMTGTFTFSDASKPSAFKDGEIRQSSGNTTLTFTTGADSVYTGSLKSDGTISGTTKYKDGQEKAFKLEKGAVAVATAAAANTAFDGKWGGRAEPQVRDCVDGMYELTVKNGVISGTATFYPRTGANRVSDVTGRVNADKTAVLVLRAQVSEGRSSQVKGVFDGNDYKGDDPVARGGRCAYSVVLKKAS